MSSAAKAPVKIENPMGCVRTHMEEIGDRAKSKHDIIAIKCFDELEKDLPKIGLVKMLNPETGEENWVNTNAKSTRENYKSWWNNISSEFNECCKKTGIDRVVLNTNENYVTPLMKVFKKREGK